MTIVKKIISDNKRSYDSKIKFALQADRITKKSATGKSHFELVYGTYVTLPIHLKLPVYQVLQESGSDQDDYQSRIHDLVELDESQEKGS